MAESLQLAGDHATLAIFKPFSEPAKLGWVGPLGRNTALDQMYSALDPAEQVDPTPDAPRAQTVSDDAPQVQFSGAPDGGGGDGGGTGTGDGSGDGGTGSGDGSGDGGSGGSGDGGSGDGGGGDGGGGDGGGDGGAF